MRKVAHESPSKPSFVLAYLFWHQPRAANGSEYEKALASFHGALARRSPTGFVRSYAFRIDEAPWMGGTCYEDWYLVDSFAALGALNQGAVAPPVGAKHDLVAERAGPGAGGVYLLRHGQPDFDNQTVFWFSKPRGVNYAMLEEALKTSATWCWQRQMVLGPAPEFCVRTVPALIAESIRCERARIF